MIAALHGSAAADTLAYLIALIIVIGCLVAAGVSAYRGAWIAAGALCLVAIVAAVLLLGA